MLLCTNEQDALQCFYDFQTTSQTFMEKLQLCTYEQIQTIFRVIQNNYQFWQRVVDFNLIPSLLYKFVTLIKFGFPLHNTVQVCPDLSISIAEHYLNENRIEYQAAYKFILSFLLTHSPIQSVSSRRFHLCEQEDMDVSPKRLKLEK